MGRGDGRGDSGLVVRTGGRSRRTVGVDGLKGSSSPYSRIFRSSVRVLIPSRSAVRCRLPPVWNRHCWIASRSMSDKVVPWRGRTAPFAVVARRVAEQVGGQKCREKDRSDGLEQRLLEGALQLPDVARPGVIAQAIHGLLRDLADIPAQLDAETPHEVLHQERQVIAPLAQGGQVDGEDAQPVKQVGPEPSLGRPSLQVAVGGRDQPHVGPDGLVAPEPLEDLVLEQAQDLGLEGQRHVADLVQEERAAAALLELADAAAVGPGEGALLVPE